MEGLTGKAKLYEDLSEFIGDALAAARERGFVTLVMGEHYAVITGQSTLEEALEGCLAELADTAMRPRGPSPGRRAASGH
jgi:hypothetical protein